MLKVNILILGKSGCGKSSLLNYLWGAKIADVAAGRPVTPESDNSGQGIYPHPPVMLDGLQLVIHDSWGMEANKAEKWKDLIQKESRKRDASDKISDWIHTVIYCVSAKGARIEDFELKSIISPLISEGNRVLFVLTKSDIASDNEKESLREILASNFPHNSGIIEVSSISQKLRSGKLTEAFGQQSIKLAIYSNLRQNLIDKIPAQLMRRAQEGSAMLRHDALTHYDKEAGWTRAYSSVLSEVGSIVQNSSRQLVLDIRQWLTQALTDAEAIYNLFGIQLGPESVVAGYEKRLNDQALLNENSIAWDWSDHATNVVLHLLPGINVLFMFAKKDVHRDMLIEKLDAGVKRFDKDIEAAAEQIRLQLNRVLALPPAI